ncbi:hypothetical protein AB0M95_11815 [Sphaerisporangium sp. NPDC051017]|uniref:hypothetical protein n=1 Tax=Sphaerisporangium sp. NPDC051017 TaxID=3154636 RepID=UPI00341AC39C
MPRVWPTWAAVTASLGQGTAQGEAEPGDLPLRDLGGQERLRPVEGCWAVLGSNQ